MKYRAEIDGLRAMAVIPVMLFHAGFSHCGGGFVGVDVFFVISGYLITSIILSEKKENAFSLVRFYERRARRILPALFAVMLFSLLLAWFCLLPSDMIDFSNSLIAVPIFASNILFSFESGYWDAANELKPLMHTWSLAVEEQYYLLFPLFLLAVWRFRKRYIVGAFLIVAAGSLSIAQWGAYNQPVFNFFMLWPRAWELAVGAVIAFYSLFRSKKLLALVSHKPIAEVSGMVGLLMIAFAVGAFDESIPHPSLYTLAPTLGTGLVIVFASRETLVGRLLGTRLLSGLGLISYSAYLWHQPLFAFARHKSLKEPSDLVLGLLCVVSIALAYLSWRYVERPFRTQGVISRKGVFAFALTASAVFIAAGSTGRIMDGFGGRVAGGDLKRQSIQLKLKTNRGLSQDCSTFPSPRHCSTSSNPEILIWGDSLAMHLVQGIIASRPDARIIQMTKSYCGPLFDVAPVSLPDAPARWAAGCLEFTGKVREWLKSNNTIKYVVMSSTFGQYLLEDAKLLLRNGTLADTSTEQVSEQLAKTLGELREMGLTPILFSPPPMTGGDIGRCLARAETNGANLDVCNFQVNRVTQRYKDVLKMQGALATDFRVVRLESLMCNNSVCRAHLDGTYLYRDNCHFSVEGSAALGRTYDFYRLITAR